MKVKELLEKYGEDYEIKISFYACANTFTKNLEELSIIEVDHNKKFIIFDGEFN